MLSVGGAGDGAYKPGDDELFAFRLERGDSSFVVSGIGQLLLPGIGLEGG
jgi:hypothetical protein